ncbi:hypothetical protein AVEN_223018-1 [Araneus ventricosus]|uniref:Uncharacterized protein n=1 Tax=Araneus ventricosus TaxID=182803 RepID=A0A4Y2QVP5_ARAVE|nr:hypothetical protein AVEN_223018-1 [Araneus ventricosus]
MPAVWVSPHASIWKDKKKGKEGREKETDVETPTSAFSTMRTLSVLVFAALQRRAASNRVGNSSSRILTSLMAFMESLISSRSKENRQFSFLLADRLSLLLLRRNFFRSAYMRAF